jgi:hypothetical protein
MLTVGRLEDPNGIRLSRLQDFLIASPSDVEEEREIAVRVIQEWNDLYSYSRKVVLLPLRWETHTALEYGTRPQEVINRAIVDECDLLVGIFWTCIGSPTGIAESGTLEEIERVGNAGTPIMLYFSRVEIDPDRINLDQIEKLKHFKDKTYPKGLVESYKKIIEFRDKFAKQLELKIRDLQRSDASGELPLSLEFLSVENGELIGSNLNHVFDHPNVRDFDAVPVEARDKLKAPVEAVIRRKSCFPIALAIENSSPSGIRNLYVELAVSATSDNVEVTKSPMDPFDRIRALRRLGARGSDWEVLDMTGVITSRGPPKILEGVERNLAKFDEDKLQRTDRGWRLSVEWEALQPRRIRIIKPVLYVYSRESAKLSIKAKVFADSFPEPFVLEASVSVEAKQSFTEVTDVLPDWKDFFKSGS